MARSGTRLFSRQRIALLVAGRSAFSSRPRFSRWLLLPYLFLADIQNTLLSALFTFSGRVLYPHYAAMPRLGGISAQDDQVVAGVLMWVPGSIAYLLPLAWIGAQLLYGRDKEIRRQGDKEPGMTRWDADRSDRAAAVAEK